MSIEKGNKGKPAKNENSVSSFNSALTDEALEKEEEIKKLKKNLTTVKNAYRKEKTSNEELTKEVESLKAVIEEQGLGSKAKVKLQASSNRLSEEDYQSIKESYEKEAYLSKKPVKPRNREEPIGVQEAAGGAGVGEQAALQPTEAGGHREHIDCQRELLLPE